MTYRRLWSAYLPGRGDRDAFDDPHCVIEFVDEELDSVVEIVGEQRRPVPIISRTGNAYVDLALRRIGG